jgi:hypothetical protein
MKKVLLLTLLFALFTTLGFSQADKFWSANTQSRSSITTDKAVARLAYPKEFKLFNLNIEPLRKELFTIVDNQSKHSTIISLPNADGNFEQFEVYEASNFEPALQAKFPEIRAYSGKGITDKYALLKLSISPQGISTMVFRADNPSEFIEAYSQDHTIYSVYKSQRDKGKLPWTCTTEDKQMDASISKELPTSNWTQSSTGELKTLRLAQSCNGEYANYFGATSSAQVALVLAGFNATLTRCNGCYEKDLALHLNLIANTTDVIYYNPATDPYTAWNVGNGLDDWNDQLMNTLHTIIGDANFDIGHMFGRSGGGGNAGCIGCVCTNVLSTGGGANNSYKGAGITSPADNIPQGDNFDIDYVVHEVGHQLGGNHTFSHGNEGTGVNKEVGSGITIMGYAGITNYDLAPHSIDIYHEASIQQIQNNLAGKTCPITTNITANNATPVVAPVSNYTIPISTPFALTGSATDANNDPLTYCWEQNDNSTTTGAGSNASPTKTTGPNWLSWSPTASPTRLLPKLSTILVGGFTTAQVGGDAGMLSEALSSVSRTLNFRLTVRDNSPYVPVSPGPAKVGQTAFTDMVVTVTNTSGPFQVTVPNTNVSWPAGSTQTITWDVNNTTAAPVSCANVKISLSTDGGQTFPTVLSASTANDGTESVTMPSISPVSTCRVKIEAVGNIFFDISNTNFNITAATNPTFNFTTPANGTVACGGASAAITLATTSVSGFVTPIVLTNSALPGATTIAYAPNPVTPGNSSVVTLSNMGALTPGTYPITITGTAGAEVKTVVLNYVVTAGTGPAITAQPAPQALCAGGNTSFSITSASATSFQWQFSTDGGANWNTVPAAAPYSGTTSNTLNITGVTGGMNGYQYRNVASVPCGSTTSNAATLTVNTAPAITNNPGNSTVCTGSGATFSVTATGAGLTYQWQLSTDGGGSYNNIANGSPYSGVLTNTLSVSPTTIGMNNYRYRVVVTGTCPSPATSTGGILTVIDPVTVATSPANATVCTPGNTSFTAAGTSTVTVNYQWQVSTDGGGSWNNVTNGGVYSGATAATLNLTGVPITMDGYRYRALLSNATCTSPATTTAAILTVQVAPTISTNPVDVTLCVPNAATFSVTAAGSNLTYQWQLSTDGGTTWGNLANASPYSGVLTATLTVNPTAVAMTGNRYRCVVSGSCPPAVTSSAAILTVIAPVSVTTQPVANGAVCNTYNRSFSVTASSTVTIIYQWQVSTDGGATWNNISNTAPYSGVTTNTMTITGATLAMNNYRYRVLLSNATCTSPTVSNAAVLTVNPLPNVAATANPPSVCTGTPSTLTATGADTYVWASGTTPATGAVVTVAPVVNPANPSVAATTTYTVTGTITATGCFNTGTVPVIAEPLPVVTLAPASPAALLPGQSVTLTATVVPAGGNFALKWFKDNVDINFSGTSRVITVNDLGSYKVTAANAVTGLCSTTSNIVTVTAAPSAKLFIYPSPTSGRFTVSYYNAGAATQQGITIYDSKGARVFNKVFAVTQPYQLHAVDLRAFGHGIYYVILRDASGKKIKTGQVAVE